MRKQSQSLWTKLSSLMLMLGLAGMADAKTLELGSVGSGSYSFTEVVTFGQSFTNYVGFTLAAPSDVSAFVRTFDMSLGSFDLLGIDNFSVTLQTLGTNGFQTLSSVSTSPASFDDFLAPGQYRIALSGIGTGLFGGLYSGSLQVAAVPEADVWIMLLVGFAAVLYQLRRKQRTLEHVPVAA